MPKNNYKAMTVYKASAGSGKTFTLAIRFIELLIQKPEAYRETLAVTFTNKATEEMKKRILSQLYGLWKQLPDSTDYSNRICNDLQCDKDFVSEQAGRAMKLMLHDYSYFNIETIDAFFQKVLRNLAREMNLNANLRVELNDFEIEEKAVDKLIADLNDKNPVLHWILGYIDDNIADDRGWNVIDNIKKFGRKIFSDDYKRFANALQEKFEEKGFFTIYQHTLRDIITNADKEMKEFAKRFDDALAKEGYTVNDLSYKSAGAAGFFVKLNEGKYLQDDVWNTRTQKAGEGPEGWVGSKIKPDNPLYDFAATTLTPLINDANAAREALMPAAITAKAITKNLNELRLLSKIKNVVEELNADENRFLLSDTQNLLHQMMIDSDVPFIFEKIGGQLKNIMIDEFQDTSTVQWQNFRILLMNCIAKMTSLNLIVGDVKQSIYRWRNGDWKLLHYQIKKDEHLTAYGYKEETLETNYRSEDNIIRFNNAFFEIAARQELLYINNDDNDNSAIIAEIYNDVKQEIPTHKNGRNRGLVDIQILTNGGDDESPDYNSKVKRCVARQIQTLFDAGADDESICIIARNNKELADIAEYLQTTFPDHTFVSDEAFLLDASCAVNIIISAIRVMNHPNDKLCKAQLAKIYQEKICGRNVTEVFFRDGHIDKYLPKEFVDNRTMLLTKPLTDLVEELFLIFQLQSLEGEAAYIMAFYDQLDTFSKNNIPDLELLLDTWEESMHKKTVKGGSLTGVRLLTIHKSKGLEADHVLIPFCDWNLDPFGSDLWCNTSKMPFGELPVITVNTQQIKNSYFDHEYQDEQLQIAIDNMNMLYVAFTRACKNLFVIAVRPGEKNSKRSRIVLDTVAQLSLDGSSLTGDVNDKNSDIHFTYGSLYVKAKEEKNSKNIFLHKHDNVEVMLRQDNNRLEFRQSNASRRFVEPPEDEHTQLNYTTTGTILHNLLARIKDHTEVEKVLNEFVQDGLLSETDSELNHEKLSSLVRSRIETNKNTIVNRWFSAEVDVFNECTLIGYDDHRGVTREFRPDRVVKDGNLITVIDYKFGSKQDDHARQVKKYIELLSQMGYDNVRGYLWYVYKNEINEVS